MIRLSFALLATALSAAPVVAADPPTSVVFELYQSQGCSSCPPTIANINSIAGRPDVLALTFAVTYWDQLGWEDTFAEPALTARQWDYAHAGGRSQVATPQGIVNGQAVTNGGDRAALLQAIRQANRGAFGPTIELAADHVTVGGGSARQPATVWLVRYDSRTLDVPIRAGENGGKTLAHRNVVRSVDRLGRWTGAPATFAVPASMNRAYAGAILVQQGKGGPIMAAARI